MRRIALCLAVLMLAGPAVPAFAPAARAQGGQPPHAWLFGTWSGGLFPVPAGLSTRACFGQPVVIFTRDLVMRATLIEQTLTERVIETVRSTPSGLDFRFASGGGGLPLLGGGAGQPVGFGCASANELVVQRRGENEIAFPGCADFPNPLVRCK